MKIKIKISHAKVSTTKSTKLVDRWFDNTIEPKKKQVKQITVKKDKSLIKLPWTKEEKEIIMNNIFDECLRLMSYRSLGSIRKQWYKLRKLTLSGEPLNVN